MAKKIVNPILPGFYPDPSVCVANGAFYLVNSSFSYFPGLPIFKSLDCVSWEQIGNIIDRPEQLDFSGQGVSRGLFAPTIRFHDGKFYCICTQVDKIGNFFVTAENPEGPWSNPIPIEGAEGIDPSLFFDDDGTSWYVGTRPAPEGCKYDGNWEIWIQKIDLNTGKLLGTSKGIWRGALKNCIWPEGPHIYKIDGMYYLIHAEGGTGPEHAVCCARCSTIDGEWEGCPRNPIITHRHLGRDAGITCVGHGDIFCDNDGHWWMVLLASRPYGEKNERFCNLGRETFMVPVKWENGWPLASWHTGLVENAYLLNGLPVARKNDDGNAFSSPTIDDFNSEKLADYWLSLRSRNYDFVNCNENSGFLRLYGGEAIASGGETSMLLRRQTGFSYECCTKIECNFANDGDSAGIICFQNELFNYRFQITRQGKISVAKLIRICGGEDEILNEQVITGGTKVVTAVLRVVAEKQKLHFQYGPDERNMITMIDEVDASILSVEKAGGFVGTVVGMFAVSGGDYTKKEFYADFDWFKFETREREWTDNV